MYSLSFSLNSLIFLPSSIKPIFLYKTIALSFVENTPREIFSINGLSLAHSSMPFINDFPIPLPLNPSVSSFQMNPYVKALFSLEIGTLANQLSRFVFQQPILFLYRFAGFYLSYPVAVPQS